ncbi:MAG TPA: hypothetical protein VG942_17870, partial [Hyphomonadaceae bacterium]|nr:hypothetical protein [Hyphomonadaceae bacterium]
RRKTGPTAQADIETADAARKTAIERFQQMGARALARAGGSAPDVKVDVTSSNYGRDQSGLYVEIGGTVSNTSDKERKVDALMVAFVDRLELPLSSVAVPADMILAPGESRAFSQRLEAGVTRGRNRAAPATFAERRSFVAPARLPPRDIPWQVRVGAMSRQ